jgi:hypothetical protein
MASPRASRNVTVFAHALEHTGGYAPGLSTHAMSGRLFALRLFARVARKGSFSAAGRELNIPEATHVLVVLRPFLWRHSGSRAGVRHVKQDDK